MKNINEDNLKKYIQKKLQESYFDGLEFDEEAMRAAQSDIEADSASGEFEELGTSKFEKDPEFGDKFKGAIDRANLELPSDEEEVERMAQMIKRKKDQEDKFGKGSLNEAEMEYIRDADGNPIKLKSPVQHQSGVNGFVERFVIGDGDEMKVKVNWIQDPNVDKLNPIVSPEDIIVNENTEIMNEEAYESSRYMFFGNLEQVKRQAELLLNMNEDEINEILENGHDWAQDHIATAKESIDQVFDFIMNETKKEDMNNSTEAEEVEAEEDGGEFEEEIEEGMGHSFTVGMNKNEKPVNYPEELMRETVKNVVEEMFSQYTSTSKNASMNPKTSSSTEGEIEKNLGTGVKFQDIVSAIKNVLTGRKNIKGELENLRMKNWKGTPEGWHEFITNKQYFSGTNEGIEEGLGKYYVPDTEFNKINYPDLTGKFFEDEPMGGVEFETMEKDEELGESSSDSLINKQGTNAKPNTSYLKEGYEKIIQLQDNQANHVFTLLKQDGPEEAIEYLKEWHKPGTHEILSEMSKSPLDKSFEKDGYTIIWNPSVGYVELSYDNKH